MRFSDPLFQAWFSRLIACALLLSISAVPAAASTTRAGAVPFALEVGDIDGQPGAEWVTTAIEIGPLNPATGVSTSSTVTTAAR